jgi:clan AA aspartic protease
MIVGAVNTYREAVISLKVQGPDGQEQEIEAIVDTGFNGSLTLPSALITALELPFRSRGRAIMADGRENLFDIHKAKVIWEGRARPISVHAAETDPLVGMALVYGYELTIQVVEGGSVIIARLS